MHATEGAGAISGSTPAAQYSAPPGPALDHDGVIGLEQRLALMARLVRAGQRRSLRLVGEADRRAPRPIEKRVRTDFVEKGNRSRIDRHDKLFLAGPPHQVEHGGARPRREQRVARDMQEADPVQQAVGQILQRQTVIRTAIRQEASLAIGIDQADQCAGLPQPVRCQDGIDAVTPEVVPKPAGIGGAYPAREAGFHAEMGKPGRLVRARAAGKRADCGPAVGAPHQRTFGANDDVGHDVADDEDARLPQTQARLRQAQCAGPSCAASAQASRPATAALFFTSAILACRLRPPVSSKMRLSR